MIFLRTRLPHEYTQLTVQKIQGATRLGPGHRGIRRICAFMYSLQINVTSAVYPFPVQVEFGRSSVYGA